MRPVATQGASLVSPTERMVWDATLVETYTLTSDLTDHEVEDGSVITDHVRKRPAELQLEVIATTAPLTGETNAERDRQFRAQLQGLWDRSEQLSVLTESVDADGWVIVSISESIDAETGEACRPRVSLRRVRVVERQTAQLPPLAVTQRRLARTEDTGSQQTSEDADGTDAAEAEEALASYAYRLAGGNDAEVNRTISSGGAFIERARAVTGSLFQVPAP
jgi:hypothetical protein